MTHLIDDFLPRFDVTEHHSRTFQANSRDVWRALHEADLGGSLLIRILMGLRMLPTLLSRRGGIERPRGPLKLEALARAGFGILAEEPEREVVLGIEGKFWRPAGNVRPFERARFDRPVEPGLARGVWNFALEEAGPGRTRLATETRVLCGDPASRRKFRAYWTLVRPGSGLIRHAMLAAVARKLASKR